MRFSRSQARHLLAFSFLLVLVVACTNGLFSSTGSGGGGGGGGGPFAYEAQFVLGQPDYDTTAAGDGQGGLNNPTDIFIEGTNLIVADTGNHRVLVWNTLPDSGDDLPNFVLGQEGFNDDSPNSGDGGPNEAGLNSPQGVFATGSALYIAEVGNNRVVIHTPFPSANDEDADLVLGQATFNSSAPGFGAAVMNGPVAITASAGKLYVTDRGNSRVLIFDGLTPVSGASAEAVLGNNIFGAADFGSSDTRFNRPFGISLAPNGIFAMVDDQNARILMWGIAPTVTEQAAQGVYGQANLTANGDNTGSVGDYNFKMPSRVHSTPDGRLLVLDPADNRVLLFSSTIVPTLGDLTSAEAVIGQPDFTTTTAQSGQNGFNNPGGIAATNDILFVADSGNNRILAFDISP